MFTLAQPHYGYYNPYEELAMQQELQRRRQIEAYLHRQREAEELERRREAYEAAVRAEYERRREAELELRRQAELQRRRQAQQSHGRHSMYDGGLESLFDALYGGQRPGWEEPRPTFSTRNSPTSARDSTPSPAPVSTPTPAPAQVPVAAEPQPEQEPAPEPQVDTAPSYAAVQSILASFTTLKSGFTFPTQPDFLPDSSKLAYTPNNAPIHGYEHALTGLLTRLDAVESYGDDGVRRARKEVVKTIEQELEALDGKKLEAWNRANEPQTEINVEEATEVEVDPLAVPLPEDEEAEDETMEEAGQTEPIVDDQLSMPEESPAAAESDSTTHTESTTLPDVESATSLERPTGTETSPAPIIPLANTNSALHGDSTLDTTPTQSLSAELEPLARSLTSPTPSEASESDSDMELEEYVDVETIPMPEDAHTEQEAEKGGSIEPMGDWDLDF